MKAYSIGLETEVYLTLPEIEKLRKSMIEGVSKFRGYNDEKSKEIPIRIVYEDSQEKTLEVISIPDNCYFGDARMIIFMINNQFYTQFSNSGNYSERFWTSGKLSIFAENIK
jgi:hypothetical protein